MKIREMIAKFNLERAEKDGQPGIMVKTSRKPTAKQIQTIKDNKAAILAELEVMAQERKAQIAEREAQYQKRVEEYLNTADLHRCLISYQDEFYNTTYYIETLAYSAEQGRFFRMEHGNCNRVTLEHVTETMKSAMEQSYKEYGMGGVAYDITEEQEAAIVAEQSPAKAEAAAAAKVGAEKKAQAKAAKEAEEQAEREAKFAEAKATGKPVALRRLAVNCDGSVYDCSTDILTWYAMPDGTTTKERIHTH